MKEMEPFKLLVSQHEAEKLVLKNCRPLDATEEVPISAASGRVLASDIKADRSVPPFNRSAIVWYSVSVISEQCQPFRLGPLRICTTSSLS